MAPYQSPFSHVPVLILAGGLGTRISEESNLRPKPMIEVGGIPLLVHVMRSFYAYGFRDFVVCAGYRAFEIKDFFLTYTYRLNDLDLDLRDGSSRISAPSGIHPVEQWRVRVIDTGRNAMTGCRISRALKKIDPHEKIGQFAVTYGDGVSDVNLADEYNFHLKHGAIGTVLGVKNIARFGELDFQPDGVVTGFLEKPESRQGYINGGFFFFRGAFRAYLSGQEGEALEQDPLRKLSRDGGLRIFCHDGFWHPVDTLRDKNHLQDLWDAGKAPWASSW